MHQHLMDRLNWKDLEAAISAEEYERAAKLRDEIRSLEKENEKEGK